MVSIAAVNGLPSSEDNARRQWAQFKRAYDLGHDKFLKEYDLYDAFYCGEQWADEDLKRLAETRRPALTLNMVLPTINTVLGEQTQTRVDIVYKPRRPGWRQNAEALSKVVSQVLDANRFKWLESEVFQDGLIGGRGFYDIRLDFERDVRGEIRIKARDPREVVLDPDAKEYDPSTWRRVYTYAWLTPTEIEEQYGKEKANELISRGLTGNSYGRGSIELSEADVKGTFGDDDGRVPYGDEEDKRRVTRIRVIECQHKVYTKMRFFVDYATGDMSKVPTSWTPEQEQQFMERFGLGVMERYGHRIRWTVTADGLELYDDWSFYDNFSIVPYFAFFRRGKPFGLVKNLVSPQEMLNKVSSQELHVVNTTANSGWVVEDGTLVNMDEHELENRGAETGIVLIHARNSNAPQKIQPNQIPSGLDRISTKAGMNIREISGVNDGMLGQTAPNVSGIAMQQKEARGQVQIQVPLDNLAKTRHLVAERLLALVQKFYTEERTIRIINDFMPGDDEQEMVVNELQADGSIARDLTVGDYDVVIGTQPDRDNFEEAQFAEAVQLRELGVAIPDHVIVEYSQLSRKADLAQLLKAIGGFNPPTEEEAQMQQMQQEMAIREAELALAKMESEARELQARASLQEQKADSMLAADDHRLAQLESHIMLKREELATRRQLAALTQQVRVRDSGIRAIADAARIEAQRDVARINVEGRAAGRPSNTKAKEKKDG